MYCAVPIFCFIVKKHHVSTDICVQAIAFWSGGYESVLSLTWVPLATLT